MVYLVMMVYDVSRRAGCDRFCGLNSLIFVWLQQADKRWHLVEPWPGCLSVRSLQVKRTKSCFPPPPPPSQLQLQLVFAGLFSLT